ncbi:MAG: alpha-E domain-containing protein [Burkholderiaceae bacterium]
MLSRTADHLFWMARYVERAENTARMLDVNHQTSLLPQSEKNAEEGWRALLGISELQTGYDKVHDKITARNVIDYMARDPSNTSSIFSCIRRARENARAVRGSLTTEFWETSNATWLEVNNLLTGKMLERDPSEFFEWVKFRSHLSRGVMIGTMLKDEAFHFARMGTFLERADNTARLLDVKYHGMAELGRLVEPTEVERNEAVANAQVSSQGDFYYWAAVLRSVSAFEIYRRVYSDLITPARVAELMILRGDMPRSLSACVNEVVINLSNVSNDHSQETERRAGMLRAELEFGRIDDILQTGLHAWLTNFLERVNDLGGRISGNFLVWNA